MASRANINHKRKRCGVGDWRSREFYGRNVTYVCFDCRKTRRIKMRDYSRDHNCAHCGKKMFDLHFTIEVPIRTNDNGWKKLQKRIEGV